MSRRIEIELTSRTSDGGFTWRAAGAKQPKGTLTAEVLPAGVAVGDVVRAEVESGLDGLEVVAVMARPETVDEAPPNRIEVLGAPRRGPEVIVTYASGGRRRREDGPRGPEGRQGRGERPGSREAGARRPPAGRGPAERSSRPRRDRSERAAEGAGEEGAREERPPRSDAAERGDRRPAAGGERRPRPEGDRRGRAEADRRGPASARRDRRPTVSTTHRNALLAALGPQELPIAEQLLRGGIPAVRQAIAEQNAGQPRTPATPVNNDAVLSIAEQLLPRVNLATWKDRASSAQVAGKELRLRELRAVVTASRTVTLDDDARALAKALHESLDLRVRALRDEWLARLTKSLDDGRVADALNVASRPPEPATRLPAELAVRLADAAGAAMTAETDPSEWLALLQTVVESTVRRTVKPRGIPAVPETQEAARRAAGSVPELAKLLGLRIPPPPPRRPAAPGGTRVMAAGGAAPAAGR